MTASGSTIRVLARLPLVLVGLVLLATGVGLGPRHYAAQGLTTPAATGFALAGAGLVLAAWMTTRVLASTRKRWWAAILTLLAITAYLVLWTLGQAVAATYAPRPALGGRTPADLGLSFSEVSFDSRDGVELSGWFVPGHNGAAVAVMHGAGSTRTAVLDQAAVLARHGYAVLLLDARGHGTSDGRAMDFGWYGEADAAGAVNFLAARPDVDDGRIALLGTSMGGEQAIGAAGADERVAAVVAEGATNRVAADKGYLSAYGARGAVQQAIDSVTTGLTDLLSDAPRPEALHRSISVATAREVPTPFLLVTAGNEPDEGLAAARMQDSGHGLVEVWTVDGAGHTHGLDVVPAEWETRVIGFLDRSLGR